MSDRRTAALLLWATSLAGACVVSTHGVDVQSRIQVTIDGGGRTDFFDANDPRLIRALQETEAVVGHPVRFAFHYAMLPRPQGQFMNTFFERALGTVPRDLARLRARSPQAFAFAAPGLQGIFFDYDGSRSSTDARFDGDTGTVIVRLSAQGHLPDQLVGEALLASFRDHLVARFHHVSAREVPPRPADRELYVIYLTELSSTGAGDLEGDDQVWSHPRARAIVNAIELESTMSVEDASLRPRLREWLLDAAGFFEHQRSRRGRVVARAPEGSDYARAERAWAGWVMARFDDLTDAERLALLPDLFVPSPAGDRGAEARQVLPGVDFLGLWLRVVDRWIAAGAPVADDEDSDALPQALFEHAVCPYRPPVRSVADEGIHCRRNPLYRAMLEDQALFDATIDAVLSRDHAGLTAALTQRVMEQEDAAPIIHLWRRLEGREAHFLVATRVMAAHFELGQARTRREVFHEVAPRWRAEPSRRGALLYVIAAMDHPDGGNPHLVRWDRFAEVFGAPVSRETFAAFLAQGWLAFAALDDVWPALDRGFSRAEVILEALERWIDDQDARAALPGFPATTLRGVVTLIGGDRAELGRVRRWLEVRVREHPGEEPQWRNLLGATSR
jgi:hypothetical protein